MYVYYKREDDAAVSFYVLIELGIFFVKFKIRNIFLGRMRLCVCVYVFVYIVLLLLL